MKTHSLSAVLLLVSAIVSGNDADAQVPASALRTHRTATPNVATQRSVVAPAGIAAPAGVAVEANPAASASVPTPASSVTAASNHAGAVPPDLFDHDDSAIIMVGGRQTRAANLKNQIRSDLARSAGATPAVFRGPTRKVRGHIATTMGMAATPSPGARIGMAVTPSPLAGFGNLHAAVVNPKSCKAQSPGVVRTPGLAASGDAFTVEGICFGEQSGSVELIGQFSGGALHPAFQEWTDDRIVVVMPSVRGVPDHTMALTVVRADRNRSTAQPVKFVAARERVEVATGYWNPQGSVDQTQVSEGGGNIFSGFRAVGTGGTIAGNFRVQVNPQCALDNLEIPSSAGRVVSVAGFEDGPMNEAAVTVTYAPNCTTKTFDYVVGNDSTTWCRIAFQLRTWAYCPAGTQP
jgi:hypothetical protein